MVGLSPEKFGIIRVLSRWQSLAVLTIASSQRPATGPQREKDADYVSGGGGGIGSGGDVRLETTDQLVWTVYQ